MIRRLNASLGCIALLCALSAPVNAQSLREAVQTAIDTHPNIRAAQANRDAAAYELKQAQGRFAPTVDVFASAGTQVIDRPLGFAPERNNIFRGARQAEVIIQQVIFTGFDRANDVYRTAARIDAASLRVLERSTLTALDAIEAYIDVVRNQRILGVARRNVSRHLEILEQVKGLVEGGKAPDSDIRQTMERVTAARALAAQIEQSLKEANARFYEAVGTPPRRLQRVGLPKNLPKNLDRAIEIALHNNSSIRAAAADQDVARFAKEQSKSAYYPIISLRARGLTGEDINGTPGQNDEFDGRVVLSWNLFDGNIKTNRKRELNARLEQTRYELEARAREVREAVETAYAAFRVGRERVALARSQIDSSQRIVVAYEEEYKLARRSLLDLLDAEAGLFNSRFQLASLNGVYVFAGYRLLGSMSKLLSTLRVRAVRGASDNYRERVQENLFEGYLEPLR